jgi:hypothetical protein
MAHDFDGVERVIYRTAIKGLLGFGLIGWAEVSQRGTLNLAADRFK